MPRLWRKSRISEADDGRFILSNGIEFTAGGIKGETVEYLPDYLKFEAFDLFRDGSNEEWSEDDACNLSWLYWSFPRLEEEPLDFALLAARLYKLREDGMSPEDAVERIHKENPRLVYVADAMLK